MGLQGMQALATATMKSDLSMSMAPHADNTAGSCTNCDGTDQSAMTHCETVSICSPSIAVLPIAESMSIDSNGMRFEAENVSFDGRSSAPELHPPKSAALW